MQIELSEKEVKKLFSWLGFQAHEVDIDEESFELFKKLEPTIKDKQGRYSVDCIYDKYKRQQD